MYKPQKWRKWQPKPPSETYKVETEKLGNTLTKSTGKITLSWK